MRILVVGAGAVGGYFGGRLAQAGRDVTFLVRERRAAQLQTGLHIHSPHGDATVPVILLTAADLQREPRPFDIILLGTKSYSLAAAMDDIAPAIGPGTAIVPLLNGMRHLDELSARFGPQQVLGGSVRIIADLTDDGTVEQLTPLGELSFGPRADVPGQSNRFDLPTMLAELSAPDMVTLQPADVLVTLWQKWWILASMNGICILSGGTLGQAVSTPSGPAFCRGVLDECTGIAQANGYTPDPAMLADHLARLRDTSSPLTTSMFRDMNRGYPVEADHIFGDLLARARGSATPRLEAAYVRLKVYEATRAQI